MIANSAGLLLCNALFFAAGAGVVRALGGWRTARGLLRRCGVVYLAGIAAVGVTLQLLLVLGVPFSRATVIGVTVALALTGVLNRRAADAPAAGARIPSHLLPVVLTLAAIVGLMAVDLWFQPLGVWDAWAQWTAKARALVLFDGLNESVLSSSAYRPWNPDYPVLLPAIEASDFTFMRSIDTRAIHLQFWLVYAGLLLALLQVLRGRVREELVWPFVLAVSLAPAVQIQSASALADVPVAAFFALAGVFAWDWLVDADRLALRLLTLFSAGALATKFEGRLYVGALFVALTVMVLLTARQRVVPTLVAGAIASVGLLPWSFWVSRHDVVGIFSTSLGKRLGGDLLSETDRIPLTLQALGRNVFDPSRWLLTAFVVVVVLVIAKRALPGHPGPKLVVGTLALIVVGLVFVYWATPLNPRWHLRQSARRVVTGPMLFAIALAPLLLETSVRSLAARLTRAGGVPVLGPGTEPPHR